MDVPGRPHVVIARPDGAGADEDGVGGRAEQAHEEAIGREPAAHLASAGGPVGVERDDPVERADEVGYDRRTVGPQPNRQVRPVSPGEIGREPTATLGVRPSILGLQQHLDPPGVGRRIGRQGCAGHLDRPIPLMSTNSRRRSGCSTYVASIGARPGHRIVLADAAHLRAQVMGLEVHRDAVWLEHRHQPVGDLVGHPLLHAEPPRRHPDQPGQLADPDDLLVGDVPDVRPPEERQHVVLAQREERDRPLDDLRQLAVGPAVTLGREGRQQLRVAVVAVGRIEQRPDEPARGLGRARRRQVHPERGEDLGGIPLEAGPVLVAEVALWNGERAGRVRGGSVRRGGSKVEGG